MRQDGKDTRAGIFDTYAIAIAQCCNGCKPLCVKQTKCKGHRCNKRTNYCIYSRLEHRPGRFLQSLIRCLMGHTGCLNPQRMLRLLLQLPLPLAWLLLLVRGGKDTDHLDCKYPLDKTNKEPLMP